MSRAEAWAEKALASLGLAAWGLSVAMAAAAALLAFVALWAWALEGGFWPGAAATVATAALAVLSGLWA